MRRDVVRAHVFNSQTSETSIPYTLSSPHTHTQPSIHPCCYVHMYVFYKIIPGRKGETMDAGTRHHRGTLCEWDWDVFYSYKRRQPKPKSVRDGFSFVDCSPAHQFQHRTNAKRNAFLFLDIIYVYLPRPKIERECMDLSNVWMFRYISLLRS